MKKRTIIIALLMAFMLTMTFTACEDGSDKKTVIPLPSATPAEGEHPTEAVGLWKLDRASKDGTTLSGTEFAKFELNLKQDGTGIVSFDDAADDDPAKTGNITWAVSKGKLIINDGSASEEADFDGSTITFPDYQGTEIQAVFKK